MLRRAGGMVLATSLAFWIGTRVHVRRHGQSEPTTKPISTSVLDHLEKVLSENYRKEMDQEENVWRTIPFFIAGLAFEVSIITQIRDSMPDLSGWLLYVNLTLIFIAMISVIVSLYFLLLSIKFARFKYMASEPELADFAYKLEAAEADAGIPEGHAIRSLKMTLISQYAVTTANNRAINSRRVRFRTSAGFAILVSILATLLLGGEAALPHIMSRLNSNSGSDHGDSRSTPPGGRASQGDQLSGGSRNDSHRTTPDPSSRQGAVHAPGEH